jgi:hypothetical protein
MKEKTLFKIRVYITSVVTISIWLLLVWNYYHEGIPKHHILADETLPEISNAWGAILLPILTWFLLYRTHKRITRSTTQYIETSKHFTAVVYGLVGAMLFGILLSVFFMLGYSDIPSNMLLGLLLFSFFFPIYRAECILGFVVGMTFTFGAVLPTGIGSILALIGAFLYLIVRPIILYAAMRVMKKRS